MFPTLVTTVFFLLFSGCAARLGEVKTEDSVSATSQTRDFGNVDVLKNFIFGDLITEPFIYSKESQTFKHDPLRKVTREIADSTPGVRKLTVLFDMLDRFELRGLATPGSAVIKNFTMMAAWYQSQPALFKARYQLLPQPVPTFDVGYLLSSPGLPMGQFRTETLNGLPFFEASRFARFATTPTCVPVSPIVPNTPPSPTSYIYVLFLRSLKAFWKAGQTVRTLTDPNGNVFYQVAFRAPAGAPLPGYTAAESTLTEDEENACLYSKFAPKNQQLEDPLICKMLQLADHVGNTYIFIRGPAQLGEGDVMLLGSGNNGRGNGNGGNDNDSEDEADNYDCNNRCITFANAYTIAGPPGEVLSCDAISMTQPIQP